MASSSDIPSPTSTGAAYESGDIELRFGNNQHPLRAHSVLLKLASPTVLAHMIDAVRPKASYLLVVGEPIDHLLMDLDILFPAMPILHKYNFSKLLKQTELHVPLEETRAKGTKKTKHSFGEWLWLAEELQLVGLHGALHKLLQGLQQDNQGIDRLFQIGKEVDTATRAKKRPTAAIVVMAELSRLGVQEIVHKEKATRCISGQQHKIQSESKYC
eukprot:gene7103-207_t